MTIEEYFFSSLDAETIERILIGAIVCNAKMDLTDDQKAIARQNIDAGREDKKFAILGYFETPAELPEFPTTGDAYGVGTSNYTYVVIEPEAGINPAQSGYYVLDGSTFVPTTDTTVVSGTIYYKRTVVYDIYIWDGVNNEWVNNGPLSTGNALIADGSNDVFHTLSSQKIRKMFEEYQVDVNSFPDGCITAPKIADGAVSQIFDATLLGTTWKGNVVSERISPTGTTNDYTLSETPTEVLKVEFLSAGLILEPTTDYTYNSSTGVLHFMQTPAAGTETYEVSYHTLKPPYSTTVSVPGLLATDTPIIDLVPDTYDYTLAQSQLHEWSEVFKMEAEDDALKVYCHFPVSAALPLKIMCVRK